MAHTFIGGAYVAEKVLSLYCTHTPNHRGKGLVERIFRQRFSYKAPRVVDRNGVRWSLDPNEFNQFWFLLNERTNQHVYKVLRRFLRRGETLVDVGANFGIYSVPLAHDSLALGANVVALEPNPVTFRLLSENIRLNGTLTNIMAINEAAGSEPGELVLHFSEQFLGSSSLYPAAGLTQTAKVRIQTLDAVLAQRGVTQVSVMKIDVEGHEPSVLTGASSTFATSRPPVVYELNQGSMELSGHQGDWYFTFFNDLKYTQFVINRDDTFAEIRSADHLKGEVFSDILALPNERVSDFKTSAVLS